MSTDLEEFLQHFSDWLDNRIRESEGVIQAETWFGADVAIGREQAYKNVLSYVNGFKEAHYEVARF